MAFADSASDVEFDAFAAAVTSAAAFFSTQDARCALSSFCALLAAIKEQCAKERTAAARQEKQQAQMPFILGCFESLCSNHIDVHLHVQLRYICFCTYDAAQASDKVRGLLQQLLVCVEDKKAPLFSLTPCSLPTLKLFAFYANEFVHDCAEDESFKRSLQLAPSTLQLLMQTFLLPDTTSNMKEELLAQVKTMDCVIKSFIDAMLAKCGRCTSPMAADSFPVELDAPMEDVVFDTLFEGVISSPDRAGATVKKRRAAEKNGAGTESNKQAKTAGIQSPQRVAVYLAL